MGQVVTTAVGDAAVDVVRRLLGAGRRHDPLAPGVVICPTPLTAVGLRRALGATPAGIAGVEFVTFDRLIEDLSRPGLAAGGQHRANTTELQAAIRAELAAVPGRFGSVATHRTTEERLLELHRRIVGLPPLERSRLIEAGGLSGDAVRVIDAALGRLDSARSADHLIALALEALADLPPLARGPLIVFLPEPSRPDEGRMLQAIAGRDDTTVVVGLTGHDEIDRAHLDRLAGWSIRPLVSTPPEPTVAMWLEVGDPDDEVRSGLRVISAHAAAGTPLRRMALLYPSADPYGSMIADQLTAAGLPFSGPGVRWLSRSLSGRQLLRILALAEGGLERDAVISFLAGGPVLDLSGRPAPASAWDQLSRTAGVIDDDDWAPRLRSLAGGLETKPDDESQRQAIEVEALISFIDELQANLRPEAPGTWSAWSGWAIALLERYCRPSPSWPPEEHVAFERIVGLLQRLDRLERLDPAPSAESFRATVTADLERERVPGRPSGDGLLVAPVGSVSGIPFDRVIVVGPAEGIFPRSPREDSLLPEQHRVHTGGMVLPRSSSLSLDARSVAVALAASRHRPLVVSARGELRSKRSRTWPQALDALVDEGVVVESHHRGLAHQGRPASAADLELRSAIAHCDRGDPIDTHELSSIDRTLAQGLERHHARTGGELTRHNGRVAAGAVDPESRLLSPTALEDYAACPRQYLFARVLRLKEDEAPERIEEITPRDRGSLVHEILEVFLAGAIDSDNVPDPGQSWSAEHRSRLFDVMEQKLREATDLGLTGGRVQTELLRRQLVGELLSWLTTDDDLRAERRSRPAAVELGFGFDDDPGVVTIGNGRELRLRGKVDRVDLTADDGLLVIDYKGGGDSAFRNLEQDPLQGGRRLQLPLYARVVARRLSRSGPRTALYWLTKSAALREIDLDVQLEADLDRHVGAALDGIEAGLFPARPGESTGWPRLTFTNCVWCDFDRICPTDRQREWDEVVDDPALTPIDVLLGREGGADA